MLLRYGQRKLSGAELIAADNHLAVCESCRERATDRQWTDVGVDFIRQDLATLATVERFHLSFEQLEAYVDGDLDQADREIVDSHAELCARCREELHELQKFRSPSGGVIPNTLAPVAGKDFFHADAGDEAEYAKSFGAVETSTNSFKLGAKAEPRQSGDADHVRQERGFWGTLFTSGLRPLYWSGAVAALAIVVITATLRFRPHQRSGSNLPNQATTNSSDNDAHTPPEQSVAAGVRVGSAGGEELEVPSAVTALIGKPGTLLGQSTHEKGFDLISPVGTFVSEPRPIFEWQALVGASNYEVNVFDAALNQVAESGPISGTTWTPNLPLQREQVYLWQVTATKNGERMTAPAPPAPEAKFEIVGESKAKELGQLKTSQPDAHFGLGKAFAGHGLLDEAEREFRLVPPSDAKYQAAQKFVGDLRHLRHRE